MTDSDRMENLKRWLLLSPEQRRKKHREELDRKMREQPEQMSKEAFQRGALRFFLRCFREKEPEFLTSLRKIGPTVPFFLLGNPLRSLMDRYRLPPTIAVANECVSTLLMWQAFPELPDAWHFEMPEGALAADPLRAAKSAPYPVVFVAEGWNSKTETLDQAKKRLIRQFKATLGKTTFWKVAALDLSEFRLFEESTSYEKLRRYLRCLAAKQAIPRLTYQQLASDLGCTKDACRRGIWRAAELIQLPREVIWRAPPGAPPGKRRKR